MGSSPAKVYAAAKRLLRLTIWSMNEKMTWLPIWQYLQNFPTWIFLLLFLFWFIYFIEKIIPHLVCQPTVASNDLVLGWNSLSIGALLHHSLNNPKTLHLLTKKVANGERKEPAIWKIKVRAPTSISTSISGSHRGCRVCCRNLHQVISRKC